MKIDYDALKFFVKTLEGETLKTNLRKKEFIVTDFSDYLDNLEAYENLLARGEIQW